MGVISLLEKKAYKAIEKVLQKNKDTEALYETANPLLKTIDNKQAYELKNVLGPRNFQGTDMNDDILMLFGGRVNKDRTPQEMLNHKISDVMNKKRTTSEPGDVNFVAYDWDGKNWGRRIGDNYRGFDRDIFFADGTKI